MMILMLLCVLPSQPSGSGPDGDQFMRLMEGLHSDIRDFELICEGEIRVAETAPDLKPRVRASRERAFQGGYAYRVADGAAYLDLYERPFAPNSALAPWDLRSTEGEVMEVRARR